MARARRRDQWDHTANLLALTANINRDPKKTDPVLAEDIHPFRDMPEPLTAAEKREALKLSFAALKENAFRGQSRIIPPFTAANATR